MNRYSSSQYSGMTVNPSNGSLKYWSDPILYSISGYDEAVTVRGLLQEPVKFTVKLKLAPVSTEL